MSDKSKSNTLWCVHIQGNKKTISGLTPNEVKAISAILTSEELRKCYIWSQYLNDWEPLAKFPELLEYSGLRMGVLPPPFTLEKKENTNTPIDDQNLKNLVSRTAQDESDLAELQDGMITNVADLTIDVEEFEKLPRAHKRYNKTFPVELECQGKVFKTMTTDISTGGMKIVDPLPSYIFGYFTVRIFQPQLKQELVHTCWSVEDQKPNQRFHLAFLPFKKQETEDQFARWLDAA